MLCTPGHFVETCEGAIKDRIRELITESKDKCAVSKPQTIDNYDLNISHADFHEFSVRYSKFRPNTLTKNIRVAILSQRSRNLIEGCN